MKSMKPCQFRCCDFKCILFSLCLFSSLPCLSLRCLATEVVTVFVFQEPSLLSSLQDNGLTDVMLHALLIKDVSLPEPPPPYLPSCCVSFSVSLYRPLCSFSLTVHSIPHVFSHLPNTHTFDMFNCHILFYLALCTALPVAYSLASPFPSLLWFLPLFL